MKFWCLAEKIRLYKCSIFQVIGAIGILFTSFVAYELKKLRKKNSNVHATHGIKEDNQLQQVISKKPQNHPLK